MKIDIMHIAKLARLKIDEDEVVKFEGEMHDIIAMVEQIPEMADDYKDVDPAHPMELRKDEIRPSVKREELLSNAPLVQAGCVVVPKTVE
ncbi:Asp-tRNA(Asn)/Glu-tRNA(Gln) amidotransferase subunit GatC [Hydrogenoanaerobacterium sp.]|uniref:Asp-tRNA(Asn)/Glu-tRNA(Gln) amidotransferase subunit GatC n=1 Tax=Hydrogenoanaerobacterium sp. TaxID=2953763 RepID=UPI002897E21F|nr:Asp-tRNA(Asn)/Glu-tRNA(Gln) amidotransferase subunit GatC [Hydrogenoanaerobacterium sp.]